MLYLVSCCCGRLLFKSRLRARRTYIVLLNNTTYLGSYPSTYSYQTNYNGYILYVSTISSSVSRAVIIACRFSILLILVVYTTSNGVSSVCYGNCSMVTLYTNYLLSYVRHLKNILLLCGNRNGVLHHFARARGLRRETINDTLARWSDSTPYSTLCNNIYRFFSLATERSNWCHFMVR